MKTKLLIIISEIDYSYGFDWFSKFINQSEFEATFVFLNDRKPTLYDEVKKLGHNVHHLYIKGVKDYPKITFSLWKLMRTIKPDVVHTHLIAANITGLTAAFFAGVKKRIYTRHHSVYHIRNYPHMVWIDRLMNFFSTKIIAVTKTVEEVLIEYEKVPFTKIKVINHGFDFNEIADTNEKIVNLLKEKYNPEGKSPVIGVISRFTEWKGIQYIIPAFRKILEEYPDACLILANAIGDFKDEIYKLLNTLPDKSWICIRFEKDVFSLYHLFDIFVHTPVDAESEAFGQTYVEALACKIPSVFTLSGVATDFIKNNHNAMVVPYRDSEAISKAVILLLKDGNLRNYIVSNGFSDAIDNFSIENMIESLENEYRCN